MSIALALARRGIGTVSPNPAVGCVLVREDLKGRIVGRGWTQPGGRPHAETEALRQAGSLARGATAYVTLEPCNHHGETGPCSEALINAGVKRVVVAIEDPDPRTAGAGLQRLQDAGLDIVTGIMSEPAMAINAGFISKIKDRRPKISWKAAATLDGRIATQTGDSQWITGSQARDYGHILRAQYDAILIGSETARNDDPSLTCRLPGLEHRSPARIVVSKNLNIPLECNLVKTSKTIPTLVYCLDGAQPHQDQFEQSGVTVAHTAAAEDGRVCVKSIATDLADRGVTRVLIEGGGTIASSFLKADLIDCIYWFSAPKLIGSEGRPSLGETGIKKLIQSPAFTRRSNYVMGADMLTILDRNRNA